MTNSTERLGMVALTTHEVHLVSMSCSYVLQVEHRDLRIAAANLASSIGTASANDVLRHATDMQTTCSAAVLPGSSYAAEDKSAVSIRQTPEL